MFMIIRPTKKPLVIVDSYTGAASSSQAITIPSAKLPGDLLVVMITTKTDAAISGNTSAFINQSDFVISSFNRITGFSRVITGSEPASYTLNVSTPAAYTVILFRNVNSTQPVGSVYGANITSNTIPSLSASPGDLVVWMLYSATGSSNSQMTPTWSGADQYSFHNGISGNSAYVYQTVAIGQATNSISVSTPGGSYTSAIGIVVKR